MQVRAMRPEELNAVYKRVRRDFPPIEYPPLFKMRKHVQKGLIQGRLYEEDEGDAAYAFLLRADAVPVLMLFLYAVEPEIRGKGVGSGFLRALMAENAGLNGMYAEVEMAELAEDERHRKECLRRIAFYENLGFVRVEGLFYSIYGVKMHLYYCPLAKLEIPDAKSAAEDAIKLYDGILHPWERFNLRTYPVQKDKKSDR